MEPKMKTILSIIEELAATSSINEKVSILEREKDNDLLKKVFQAAYNPMINYGIKQIPDYHAESANPHTGTLESAMNDLCQFSGRVLSGNAATNHLKFLLEQLVKEDAIVLERIIGRDLRCGTSDSLASRVWPNFVPTFDVMLCDKDMSKIKYPAYAQLKSDGARVHLFYDGINVKAFSRSGKEFDLKGTFDASAAIFMKAGETFDGELLVVGDKGETLDRQTGNGILNQANKGTINIEDAQKIRMVVWDIVDTTSTIPYKQRLEELQRRHLSGKFDLVENQIVVNEDEAMDFFKRMLDRGEEGAIIKNIVSLWVPKRSKDLCKLKEINTADLLVVDVEEGTGKYTGMIGALVCETSDGKVKVNVGSGFSDEDRKKPVSEYLNKVVEVLYNTVISSKGKTTSSLFLPRFNGVRFDKITANSLEELK